LGFELNPRQLHHVFVWRCFQEVGPKAVDPPFYLMNSDELGNLGWVLTMWVWGDDVEKWLAKRKSFDV